MRVDDMTHILRHREEGVLGPRKGVFLVANLTLVLSKGIEARR